MLFYYESIFVVINTDTALNVVGMCDELLESNLY